MSAAAEGPGRIAGQTPRLDGRTALVTGGGTGIGKAIAFALAEAGAVVTICGPDAGALADASTESAAAGWGELCAVTADVTDEAQIAAAVDAASRDGELDIAVANAGVAAPGSLLHLTADDWMGPIGVNVLGTALTIKTAARAMRAKGGSIVTISSIAAVRPVAFMAAYSVSKAALDELTRCAAAELGRFGIRVNGVRPGWMRTEAGAAAAASDANQALIRASTPLAGSGAEDDPLGDPAYVARAVVYLASDQAAWTTGQLLGVCGGSSLPPPAGDFGYVARMLYPGEMQRDFAGPE